MAVTIDANAEKFYRTSNLPAATTSFTLMLWFKVISAGAGYEDIVGVGDYNTNDVYRFRVYNNGNKIIAYNGNASGFFNPGSTWNHFAMVSAGSGANDGSFYVNGSLDSNFNGVADISGADRMGVRVSWDGVPNGDYAHFKVWDAELTAAEIASEMNSVRPVSRLADLKAWLPLFTQASMLVDHSGNGSFSTDSPTQDTVDGPPIAWGASPVIVGEAAAAAPDRPPMLPLMGVG